MNRRIAKKLATESHRLDDGRRLRCTVWNSWWIEARCIGLHKRARAIYDRSSANGQTCRLLRHTRGMTDIQARQAIVDRWPDLRRRVKDKIGRSEGTEGDVSYRLGLATGEDEMICGAAYAADPTTRVEFVRDTLSYFSDRWCMQRLGRMDAMVTAL